MNDISKKFARKYEVSNLIEISESAVLENFDTIKKIHDCDIIPVLKANAYGHGLREIARVLKKRKFPYIAVDGYFEALEIRKVSKQPVLVMGTIGDNDINKLLTNNISYVVFSFESFRKMLKTKRKVKIHLEINTGMNRHGLSIPELKLLLSEVASGSKLEIEGIMTHLASADEVNQSFTHKQFEVFKEAVDMVQSSGIELKHIHATNSAGSAKNVPGFINAVRPGIALFGINILDEKDEFYSVYSNLKPALTLSSKIDQITDIGSSDTVGYNRTFQASKKTKIATIPMGYYEGIPRSLSNCPFMTTKGIILPTAGTICMNHTMLDCTDNEVEVGDKVIVISGNASSPNSIANLRRSFDQFEYSLPTGLSSTIRRVLVA
jgi:alanine racemase